MAEEHLLQIYQPDSKSQETNSRITTYSHVIPKFLVGHRGKITYIPTGFKRKNKLARLDWFTANKSIELQSKVSNHKYQSGSKAPVCLRPTKITRKQKAKFMSIASNYGFKEKEY